MPNLPTHHPLSRPQLDAAIDLALAEERLVGAVVLVAQHGELASARAIGFSDREAGLPMQQDALFRLASVSKPFVTTAAMVLVEQGRLGLDDAVQRWLPEFRPRLVAFTNKLYEGMSGSFVAQLRDAVYA